MPDAIYHVTTRIAHGAMLLVDDVVKEKIMWIIYGTALFAGVDVYACCVMDNHLHILVHVPRVPETLWTEEGCEPDAYAFGMRPPECRRPMWPRPQKVTAPRPKPAEARKDGRTEGRKRIRARRKPIWTRRKRT